MTDGQNVQRDELTHTDAQMLTGNYNDALIRNEQHANCSFHTVLYK